MNLSEAIEILEKTGNKVTPQQPLTVPGRYLYHRSNPEFRKKIKKEGLRPMKGLSYTLWWHDHHRGRKVLPAIFFFDNTSMYYPEADYDLIRVRISDIDMSHLRPDPSLDHCYMYDLPIPPEKIKYLYYGKGFWDPDGIDVELT